MLQTTKTYTQHYPLKPVKVIYYFNHSKMGFSNEITVNSISDEQALDKAKNEVSGCYGSSMIKKFSFKIK